MPPKKKIKNEAPSSPLEPEYILLTSEEMEERKLKYYNRLFDLHLCRSFIDDADSHINSLNQQQLLQEKWLDFVTCNPLPNPDIPADMRRFYSKLKYMEKENVNKNLNWLLSIDERSILSQDIYQPDITRRKLHSKISRNIGNEYKNYVTASLKILQTIDSFLANDMEVAKCSVNVLDDIVKRKTFIENEIMDLMDRFTYRIISSEDSEMRSINAITAEYYFNVKDFNIHIWCLKNVPIRFSHLGQPRLLADFHSVNVLLQIPLGMLKENLVVRLIQFNFDHLSDKIYSFTAPTPDFNENRTTGLLDLHDCLVNEWTLQMKIQAKTLQEMRQARLEYEEKMRLYEEQVETNKKEKNSNRKTKKKKKPVKPAYEPPAVGNNVVPDVYDKFLQEEQKQYENIIQNVYRPELFNFSRHEINLRKYRILGGIYQLHCIEKPKHVDYNCFNMTWHNNETKLVVDRNPKIPDNHVPYRQSENYRRFTRRMTVFEAETILSDPDLDSPWFIITIKIPDFLCVWGEPIACHFEETLKTQPIEASETNDVFNNIKEDATQEQVDLDSKLQALPSAELVDSASQDNIASKRRETYFQESLAKMLLNKRKTEQLSDAGKESLYINDFSLLKPLTKPQIRHIERHIIPRIISSYKLPKEVQHEKSQLHNKKPKGKHGRIFMQRNYDFQTELSGAQFTFDDLQNNAERIFANYPAVETLHILSYLSDFNINKNQKIPETFGELLQVVDDVKKEYLMSSNKITDLQPLERPIIIHNKRIKRMLKTQKSSSIKSISTIASPVSKKSILETVKSDIEAPEENGRDRKTEQSDHRTDFSVEDNYFEENESSVKPNNEKNYQNSEMKICWQWTREHIFKSEFDRESQTITFHTDRLGIIGFAFNRYEHFPFKYWNMEPNANDPNNEVVFTLETQHVKCVLSITASGIRAKVMEPSTSHARNPKIYLSIENPIKDFKEFKKLMQANHLNIFAEHDASFYIEKDQYCEKHLSNELHTYRCMAVHCTQMCFSHSLWNRLAKRRDIILKGIKYLDPEPEINQVEVRITPGEAFFVEILESCSDDFNVINLDYELTWRNIASYSDLHHLIVSMYPTAVDLRCKNSKMICFIRDLLSEVRPLSFS